MAASSQENPPLGKSFVSGYASENSSFPILHVKKDPRAQNYKTPALGTIHPETARYPHHVFTGTIKTDTDERVIWVYEILNGPVISGTVITPEGQIGTLTHQEVLPSTTVTPSALMVSGKVEPATSGKSVLETVTVPLVFPENAASIEKPDLIPAKFKGLVPTTTTSAVSAGTAGTPSLATGELSKSEQQVTVFKKKVSTTSREAVSLPKTIVDTKLTGEGQIATVTQTLNDEGSIGTLSPSATTIDGQIDELGDGNAIKTEVTVDDVFPATQKSIEKPDLIPAKFKGLVPATTASEVSAGTISVTPTLATGELSKSEQQVTVFKKKVSTTSREAVSLPVSLVEKKLTGEGQVATVTQTLNTAASTTDPVGGATTLEGSVDLLGDGNAIKTEVTVDDVFPATQKSIEKPDLIPAKFKGLVPTTTTSAVSAGTAGTPSLATGELAKSEQQVTVFKKKTSTTARAAVSLPQTITEQKITGEGQVATVTQTLNTVGAIGSLAPSATVVDGQIDILGDGNAVKTEVTEAVFAATQKSVSQVTKIPERFFATEVTQESSVAEGITAAPSVGTGGLGVIEQSQQRVNAFKVKTSTTTVPSTTIESAFEVMTDNFGGGVVSVNEKITSTNTLPDPDYLTTTSEVEPIGGGKYILKVGKAKEAWPELVGGKYDAEHDITIRYTQRTVDASTASTYSASDLTPIDKWRTQVKTLTSTSVNALSTWRRVTGASPDISLPDYLESIKIHYNVSGDGQAHSTNIDARFTAGDPISQTSNVTISAGEEMVIKDGYRGPAVDASTVELFVPPGNADIRSYVLNALSVSTWPRWGTKSHNIVVKTLSKELRASMNAGGATNNIAATNLSALTLDRLIARTVDVQTGNRNAVKVVRIPTCLHGELTVITEVTKALSGNNVSTLRENLGDIAYSLKAYPTMNVMFDFLQNARSLVSPSTISIPSGWTVVTSTNPVITAIGSGYNSTYAMLLCSTALQPSTIVPLDQLSTQATGGHSPTTIASNMPATWPEKCLKELQFQPYEMGWVKVKATVVDLASYHPSTW